MSFLSFAFLLFLLAVVIVFYSIPQNYRKMWILLASWFFYGMGDIRMLVILLFITANVWIIGKLIARHTLHRKTYYILGFTTNVLILCLFKYLDFFFGSIKNLGGLFGISVNITIPELLLPIGLSFIVFQATTYLGDIYHKKMQDSDFITAACFVAFFPTILSGPIQKSRVLIPQLEFKQSYDEKKFLSGLLLLLWGYFEKIFVADKLAAIINPVYESHLNYTGIYYIIAALCYSIQIYADFSAYSDIARGVSAMLGVTIAPNFKNPYLAVNLTEFWRDWHISLNEWFVEYIYIPLGGSKRGKIRKIINTFIVFGVSGLWHGASWRFLLWGVINGILQIIGQLTHNFKSRIYSLVGLKQNSAIFAWCQRIVVFVIISTTWIFFRANSLSQAIFMINKIWNANWIQIFDISGWSLFGTVQAVIGIFICLAIFVKGKMLGKEGEKIVNAFYAEPQLVKYIVLGVSWAVLIVCICQQAARPNNAFIYFQF